ncbi:hypothetical protein L484_001519 [Morus notabilis]|uniref:No apical meristem-associated C-terminal domain-containing protein n=1 Tax=Morus notabilis TaxID=981085 RepID=W9QEC0_9ROSA|nr:hypothetical protein L484_001519 [Morus notabilis]
MIHLKMMIMIINAKRKRDEKESRKKKSKVVVVDTSTARFCDLLSEFGKQAREIESRKALAQERKLQILEETNHRERKKAEVELRIMVERNEREKKEKDHQIQIMMLDTANMEPQTKAHFEHRKAESFAKLKPLSSL